MRGAGCDTAGASALSRAENDTVSLLFVVHGDGPQQSVPKEGMILYVQGLFILHRDCNVDVGGASRGTAVL